MWSFRVYRIRSCTRGGVRMVSPWRGLPSNRLRVERVVTELPECARPSSYGGLGLLEPCVLSCVLSAGRIPLRFHHVYRTHATHSVMPVYTRSTFGTDGLAQPIGIRDLCGSKNRLRAHPGAALQKRGAPRRRSQRRPRPFSRVLATATLPPASVEREGSERVGQFELCGSVR